MVLSHPEGWRYIPVHDFGGSSVDAYWCTGQDAYFLQGRTREHDTGGHIPGLYFRWSPGSPSLFVLVAILDSPAISRNAFEHVMSQLASALPPGSRPRSLTPLARAAV
jgi:hypothetical protein